ncbi:hypothetical protein NicSoilB8_45110 (plasmid) [Arthrobacter sp. NicSoilB8]|nr:hypothetical protein NicSoilB8_45110 [Arthrobacter sp. NicSoilB8]
MGEDVPEENGHSPQTCTVVPRYSRAAGTRAAAPPPRPPQPRDPGARPRTLPDFVGFTGRSSVPNTVFTVFTVFERRGHTGAI